MKPDRILTYLWLFTCLLFISDRARAIDVHTILIKADILKPANCTYDLATTIYDMGTIETLDFSGPAIGATTAWQQFNIKSTGCDSTITDMDWTYSAPEDPEDNSLFDVAGEADGVGLELALIDAGGSQVNILPNTTHNWTPRISGEDYKHLVRYKKTKRKIVNGIADTTIIVSITNHYI